MLYRVYRQLTQTENHQGRLSNRSNGHAHTHASTKMRLETNHKPLAQVDEGDDLSKEGAAPTIEKFLEHQATSSSCRESAQSVGIAKP